MQLLFERIGALDLIESEWNSYKELTCEFLSLFSLDHDHCTGIGTLSFRLGGVTHKMTIVELNNVFGFPMGCGVCTLSRAAMKDFWYSLTGSETYLGQDADSSLIVHPLLRLAQHILA